MEEQLLPNAALAPAYERAVWLYVYRDFSGNDADRAADRVCLRLGMSAYPQHLLIDPATLDRLGDTGRTVESFLRETGRVKVSRAASAEAVDGLRRADARADALEKSGSAAEARKALDDGDVLVRLRALEILEAKGPAPVVPRAAALLAEPNDALRYVVCAALKKAADPAAAPALEAVVKEPRDSLNPNVLRIRAVEALGACGTADSVAVIAPLAASGEFLNGLTRISVDALAAIAARVKGARAAVRDALARAYPPPAAEAAQARACTALAKAVHDALEKVTGRKVPFPAEYDAAARRRLVEAWE